VKRTLNPWNLSAYALSIIAACCIPRSAPLCAEAPTVVAALDQDAGENRLCHVHYKNFDRTASCSEIIALMQSEPSIPAHAHITLHASKTARYEQVRLLLQSLQDAPYNMQLGYITQRYANPKMRPLIPYNPAHKMVFPDAYKGPPTPFSAFLCRCTTGARA